MFIFNISNNLINTQQFMQMASLINQLMVKTVKFQETYLRGKNHKTLKSLWKDLIAAMQWGEYSELL